MLTLPRIDEATGHDHSRFALKGVDIRTVNGGRVRVCATTGHILAILHVEECNDQPKDGTYELPKASGKMLGLVQHGNEVRYAGGSDTKRIHAKLNSDPSIAKPSEQGFPDVAGVIPREFDGHVVSFNASLLARLATAIGSEDGSVVVHFPSDKGKAISVICEREGAFGVLMPIHMKTDGKLRFDTESKLAAGTTPEPTSGYSGR